MLVRELPLISCSTNTQEINNKEKKRIIFHNTENVNQVHLDLFTVQNSSFGAKFISSAIYIYSPAMLQEPPVKCAYLQGFTTNTSAVIAI